MQEEKIKILCVGIGGYAEIYLKSLLESERNDFKIVGMVEISPQNCSFYQKLSSLGVRLYDSMEAFYNENSADLAIITTPIHLHSRQIVCALQNGSNVMCEKPLSGISGDADYIEKLSKEKGKFVMIGYQWSYSEAVNNLKSDILAGNYGAPKFLKSIVLWPRPIQYFSRGSGWAGKIRSSDGTVINDSVANNAAAHYLHNMLYVTGPEGKSSEAYDVKADLLRVNKIENFDTAVIEFKLNSGTHCLFIASHSTYNLLDPVFEYRFENGTVSYNDKKDIIGAFSDGTVKDYGNPFKDVNEKIYEAISACKKDNYIPVCGVETAAPHVRCIEAVQKNKINEVRENYIGEKNGFLYVKGLDELLLRCYKEEIMLHDTVEYGRLIKE